mgnify:CR=1 FL=1
MIDPEIPNTKVLTSGDLGLFTMLGIFPKAFFVMLDILCRCAAVCCNKGRPLRLGQTWEVAAWEIAHLGSCHLGKYPWEVATWEKSFGKLPIINRNIKNGIDQGFYRKDLDINFISRLYFNGILGIKNVELFPQEQFTNH